MDQWMLWFALVQDDTRRAANQHFLSFFFFQQPVPVGGLVALVSASPNV